MKLIIEGKEYEVEVSRIELWMSNSDIKTMHNMIQKPRELVILARIPYEAIEPIILPHMGYLNSQEFIPTKESVTQVLQEAGLIKEVPPDDKSNKE